MKLEITGRGFDITDRVRDFADSKIEKIKKHLEDIRDATLVLSVEKYRNKAELKFLSEKHVFHGSFEAPDMLQSIDRVIERVENQVRKFKDKQQKTKRNGETIRHHVIASTPEPVNGEVIAEVDREIKIIRTDNAVVKPMSLEESVDELTKLNQDFIIFRNAETNDINVVYRRKDGNIGYIESAY